MFHFPIATDTGLHTWMRLDVASPFTIGHLRGVSVDLGQYRNAQHYESYTREEHLSWACLIAEQQRTKTRYACQEYLDGEAMFAIGEPRFPTSTC